MEVNFIPLSKQDHITPLDVTRVVKVVTIFHHRVCGGNMFMGQQLSKYRARTAYQLT